MKTGRLFLAALLACGLSGTALAGAGHGHGAKPQKGGVVVQAKDIDYELVAREGRLTLYAYDHGKPLSLAGAKAAASVHGRGAKVTAELKPVGEALVADGSFPTGLGVRVETIVSRPGQPDAKLNFRLR